MARKCSPAPPLTKIRSLFDPGWERSRCDARDTAQLLDAFPHDEGSVGCEKEGGQEVGGVGPFNGFLSAAHLVPPFLDVKDHFSIANKRGPAGNGREWSAKDNVLYHSLPYLD
jgi:hypothetical protein